MRAGAWTWTAAAAALILFACDAGTAGGEAAAPDVATFDVAQDVAPDVAEPDDAAPDADAAPDVEEGPGLGIDWGTVEAGAAPRWEPGSDDWTAVGWPSDRLRDADGRLDLSSFPDQDIDLLQGYLSYGEEALSGFGLNGAVYLQVPGGVDMESLPTREASTAPLAVVQLVNVTAGSPSYDARRPVVFRWYGDGGDPYYLPDTLALRPVFGAPLTEGETWCAVLTRGVRDAEGRHLSPAPAFVDALDTDPTLAPLAAWLADSPLRRDDVAAATCFTTQRATEELRRVAAFLDSQPAPELESLLQPTVAGELHGTYLAPNFQAGAKPYASDGGDLRFDAGGEPVVQEQERLRFLLFVPREGEMPDAGWPVVLYAHGTGGDYESCRSVADDLLEDGLAVLCIDQPLHGSRGAGLDLSYEDLVLYNFNFVNPRSGRSSFRQAAIDSLTLARMVAAQRFDVPAGQTLSGRPVALDPGHIHFFGHSHGGLSGALVLGVEHLVEGAVLSGAGGVLVHTILKRKDPVDIGALVSGLLLVGKGDLDSFHPLLSVIQMLVDATDPINYAPYWLHPADGAAAAQHVLVTEGLDDAFTPSASTDAMAAAAGIPQVGPVARHSEPHRLRGMASEPLPASLNVDAAGGARTAGLAQWQGTGHFVAFWGDEARALWGGFFETLAAGGPPVLGLDGAGLPRTLPEAAAETCAEAPLVTGADLPARLSGDTSLASDDHAPGGCGEAGSHRDLALAFRPDVDGRYRFVLTYPPRQDPSVARRGPNRVFVTTDCDAPADGCVGALGPWTLEADLVGGETYYVVVDGATAEDKGAFDVTFEQRCGPGACEGRECGPSPCGGTCGSCAEGAACTPDGQCAAPPQGDRCGDPRVVGALPFVDSADSRDFGGDLAWPEGACPRVGSGYGAGSDDVVYRFTAPAADLYTLRLDATFDAALYVVGDCADVAGTCRAGHRRWGGGERLQVSLGAGETVFVVVDGAANNGNRAGWYTLRVEACVPDCGDRPCGSDGCGGTCGGCPDGEGCVEASVCEPIPYVCEREATCEPLPQGDRCDDPLPVDALPFHAEGDTGPMHPHYGYAAGACEGVSGGWGAASSDAVYAFTPPETGRYALTLEAQFDGNLYVTADCDAVDTACLGAAETPPPGQGPNVEELFLDLEGGAPVHVVVDGWSNDADQGGAYTLDIAACTPDCEGSVCGSDGCGGSCGACGAGETCSKGACAPKPGTSCEAPRNVGSLPWKHSGSTGGNLSTYSNGCDGGDLGGASEDVAYRFTAPSDGTFLVTLEADFAAGFYVVEDCADVSSSCLGTHGLDDAAALILAEGQVVYLIVDGAVPSTESVEGGYTLRVEEPCAPSCGGRVCGPDGCGGTCGTCEAPADLCGAEGQCSAPSDLPGNTCASALEVPADGLPFVGAGTTAEALNHYGLGEGHCGELVAKGRGSADHAWRFTAAEGGRYRVELVPDGFQAVLYAAGDCADLPGTCLGARDADGLEALDLDLVAGQTVFLIVDGRSNGPSDEGAYELLVSRQ